MAEKGCVLCLTDRSELKITGVEEVVSFDENGAEVRCENGRLFVDGEGIRIKDLDANSKEVYITGKINAMSYAEEKEKKRRGVMGRLLG